jgi:hypothetical protein
MRKLTDEQKDEINYWLKEVEEFNHRFPHSCPECHGWGTIEINDPTPCPECVGVRLCPLCEGGLKRQNSNSQRVVCDDCGWDNWKDIDGCPSPPEFISWEDYEREISLGNL